MAGVPISTSSGQYIAADADAELPRSWEDANRARASRKTADTDEEEEEEEDGEWQELECVVCEDKIRVRELEDAYSNFDWAMDNEGNWRCRECYTALISGSTVNTERPPARRSAAPQTPDGRRRRPNMMAPTLGGQTRGARVKERFRRRLYSEKFWDVRDQRFKNIPLSMFFIEECVKQCDYKVSDAFEFISSVEILPGAEVPLAVEGERALPLFVKFRELTFFLALEKLRAHLKSTYDIEYFTLPFTLPSRNPGDDSLATLKLGEHVAHKFNAEHAEALSLFVVAVHRMHEVLSLMQEANTKRTAVGRGLYTKLTATGLMETVRQNMWILNNRFAYDASVGGFYRIGARRNKSAIALMNSMAAANRVRESAVSVRPTASQQKRSRWQYTKPPAKPRAKPGQSETNAKKSNSSNTSSTNTNTANTTGGGLFLSDDENSESDDADADAGGGKQKSSSNSRRKRRKLRRSQARRKGATSRRSNAKVGDAASKE